MNQECLALERNSVRPQLGELLKEKQRRHEDKRELQHDNIYITFNVIKRRKVSQPLK
jgi:hypothetical protein